MSAIADKNYEIELVSGYVTAVNSEIYNISNSATYRNDLLEKAVKNSAFQTNVTVTDDDLLITFSTCTKNNKNTRFVLIGVLREVPA